MKQLVVMCGGAGSGKSTWIKEHINAFTGVTTVVSRDAVRFEMVAPDEEYFSKEKEVFKEFIRRIKDAMTYSDNVIIDATHINIGSRSKLLRAIGDNAKGWKIVAICIEVPLEKALEHNEKRIDTRSYVPVEVVKRMWHQFAIPTFEEGFDIIYKYRPYNYQMRYIIHEKEE